MVRSSSYANDLYGCMALSRTELPPWREVISRCFHGYAYIYNDTMPFDSIRIHHSLS
jgi:hypothetical protein